jgi:hypothetical protein
MLGDLTLASLDAQHGFIGVAIKFHAAISGSQKTPVPVARLLTPFA